MSTPVLVTCTTRSPSTREPTRTLARKLQAQGYAVELQVTADVRSLGAPLYAGRLLQAELAPRTAAFFALGPTHGRKEEHPEAGGQVGRAPARFPLFMPAARALFGGHYDPAALHFPEHLLTVLPAGPLHGQPASDARVECHSHLEPGAARGPGAHSKEHALR